MNKQVVLAVLKHKKAARMGNLWGIPVRIIVWTLRDEVWEAKTQLDLDQTRGDEDDRKAFYNYISDKRKTWENVGTALLNEVGISCQGMDKVEVLNAFFASIFTRLEESRVPKTSKDWIKECVPLVKESQIREYLSKLDIHKSMGCDRMLRELRCHCEATFNKHSMIFDCSQCLGEVNEDWSKVNVTSIIQKGKKENQGNYRLVILTLIPGRVMELLILETHSRPMNTQKKNHQE